MRTLVLLALLVVYSFAALPRYNIDPKEISVSGISSGGFFSVQFEVAHSQKVKGAAVVAGGPYYCAQGSLTKALSECMYSAILIRPSHLADITKALSGKMIDNVSNLASHKVYAFSGTLDTVVAQGVMKKLVEYYNLLGVDHVKTKFDIAAQHSFVTNNYGNQCSQLGSPFINNCKFDLAGELFNEIYGNLSNSASPVESNLQTFSQEDYRSGTKLDSEGYIYVPTACQSKSTACKLHISFHGCKQGREFIGDVYARHTGLNEWAESNNIIVLYPQVVSDMMLQNPNGCFDWWGYLDKDYHTKKGKQLSAIARMAQDISGVDFS